MKEGVVIKSTGSQFIVKTSLNEVYACKIKGRFRIDGFKTTNPVAVGDEVDFVVNSEDDNNVITKIKPRKNYIIRKATNLSKLYHIVATNMDQAVLVITITHPETTTEFIDRFLVTAEAYSIPTIIVINKVDIYDQDAEMKMMELMDTYEDIGYQCLPISANTGFNVEKLKELLKDKTTLISGNSGVGKSTLINKVNPLLNLKVGEISKRHKTGKHTTTFAEMIELRDGGNLIDTPGIRGFGLIEVDKNELYHFFTEIFKISDNCKYHNCLHMNEPHCAVKKAYEEGEISESRYFNYLKILSEDEEKYR